MNEIHSTILDIYGSPGHLSGWNNAIESATRLLDSRVCGYVLVDKETMHNDVPVFVGYSSQDAERYMSEGPSIDVRFQYLQNLTPGKVFRDFEFIESKPAYDDCEWVKDQFEKLGIYYCLSSQISSHGLWMDIISFGRLKSRGAYTDEHKANLEILLPHFSKAAELHRTFTDLSKKYGLVLSVLDKLHIGLAIFDRHGRLVTINQSGRDIVDRSGQIKIDAKKRFKLKDADSSQKLDSLLAQTIKTASSGGHCSGGQIVLDGFIGHGSLLLDLFPLKDDSLPDRDNIEGCALFLLDLDCGSHIKVDGIKSLFGLTQAESEILDSLVKGMNINDIAELRNSMPDTIRKSLKNIFAKTNTNSQLDVLRLSTKLSTPIKDS